MGGDYNIFYFGSLAMFSDSRCLSSHGENSPTATHLYQMSTNNGYSFFKPSTTHHQNQRRYQHHTLPIPIGIICIDFSTKYFKKFRHSGGILMEYCYYNIGYTCMNDTFGVGVVHFTDLRHQSTNNE